MRDEDDVNVLRFECRNSLPLRGCGPSDYARAAIDQIGRSASNDGDRRS